MNKKINKLRDEIDSIDSRIVELIVRRLDISRGIIKEKQSLGIDARDKKREADIISKLSDESGLDIDLIRKIFQSIFDYAVGGGK